MSKKVTVDSILKEYEKTNNLETATLKGGEEIEFFPVFSEQKIEELIVELVEAINESAKQDIDLFENEARLFQYAYYLVIKHFTTLGEDLPDGYEKNVELFAKFLHTGLYVEILEVLPQEQIAKVLERILERNTTMLKVLKEYEEMLIKE